MVRRYVVANFYPSLVGLAGSQVLEGDFDEDAKTVRILKVEYFPPWAKITGLVYLNRCEVTNFHVTLGWSDPYVHYTILR